jgi:hypothetical protein
LLERAPSGDPRGAGGGAAGVSLRQRRKQAICEKTIQFETVMVGVMVGATAGILIADAFTYSFVGPVLTNETLQSEDRI